MSIRPILALAIAAISIPCAAQLAPPFPYPQPASEMALRHTHGAVETGWYVSSKAYRYVADLNVSFDIGSWRNAHFAFGGGVLTLIKSESSNHFEPDRYRGTIEPSVYWPKGKSAYIFSIRHQSFHSIDKPRVDKESYELYNVAYQKSGPPDLRVAVGKYEHRQANNYNWDVLAQVDDLCLAKCGKGGHYYGSIITHYVTESGNPTGRSDYLDYSLEAGIQTQAGVRYFASYRQIHDIDRVNGITDKGLLVGIKFRW